MPELPETETIARGLNEAVSGRRITSATVRRSDVLRGTSARKLQREIAGAVIVGAYRRAKLVVIELASGHRIVVQPRFTGGLIIDDGTLPQAERRYVAVSFTLDDGRTLHYRDVRRLGTLELMDRARWSGYARALGPEPLDPAFTPALLSGLLRGSRQAVKTRLMDQRRLAGVGNIYSAEALWRAGLKPSRASRSITAQEAERLHAGLTSVLRESIEARGTSFRDYRDASGARGSFSSQLAVYARGGEPCLRCGARLKSTRKVGGRATVYCAHCQK
jgi:formamidopyrimidine-DNA glycosylase